MDATQAYKIYLSLKLHFTSPKYDIRVNGLLSKIPENKKVHSSFYRFANKYKRIEWVEYLIANFVSGDKYGGAFSDGTSIYLDWLRRKESLSYVFKEDLTNMKDDARLHVVEEVWSCDEHTHPILLQAYLGNRACLETLVILNRLYKYKSTLDAQMVNDPMWDTVSHLIKKYSPFVEIDASNFSVIIETIFL